MNSWESAKLVAASGGDTVKLLDISGKSESKCVVAYSPSPGFSVNSIKWNHNNMVLASASDDAKISFWKRNGTRLWDAPNDAAGTIESISSINFCNKGSRYLCSGGSGQVVRIWDLQSKRCIKWLKGHSDTITSVMCNCKDEHIASVSCKGDLIVHNLVSGAKVAELKDPEGQVLVALDYSRISRHLLATAGDEGSVHLWDTTGHNTKVSWPKQHSAPASGVSFSPPNDKIIASIGLDMKLYTFDVGSKKPCSLIHHDSPFSSLAYSDDGLTLVAGTTTGQVVLYDTRGKPQPLAVLQAFQNSEAIASLCWQRSKPVTFNETNCTDETILLAGNVGDSTIMPDPLPSRNPSHGPSSRALVSSSSSASASASSAMSSSTSEGQPLASNLLINRTLAKLHAPLSNVKDDMEVFSPIVEVQPLTPTFDKLWDDKDGTEKRGDGNTGFLLHSRRFGLSEEAGSDENPIFNLGSSSASKQIDIPSSTLSKSISNLAPVRSNTSSSSTPRKQWQGERALEKFIHRRQTTKMPSRFAKSTPPTSPLGLMPSSHPNVTSLHGRETSPRAETSSLGSSESSLSAIRTKSADTVDSAAASSPRLFSSYADRIFGATSSLSVSSPKSKKTGTETREDILNNLSISQSSTPRSLTTPNLQKTSLQSNSQKGNSYIDEENIASFKESIHGDMQNLHLEILRQFHIQEMGMSSVLRLILENQAEIMQEIQSLREEIQHFHHLL